LKKVLVIYYSQAGQLKRVMDSFISKLNDEEISLDIRAIKPKNEYPFPWPFYTFFDEFPESVFMDGCEIDELENISDDYDLIILGYTVWYMAPAIPITAFLQSEQAKKIFKNKPVVTVVACRDMWITAQEKVKQKLNELEAKHIDHVSFVDQSGSVLSLITLPTYMLTGDKKYFSFLPSAGISDEDINSADRFGLRLNQALHNSQELNYTPLLKNLGACTVNGKLIATERIANRSFKIWSRFIKFFGSKYSLGRKFAITIYVVFLIIMLLTLVPINIISRKIINIFQKQKLKEIEDYYEQPSGR